MEKKRFKVISNRVSFAGCDYHYGQIIETAQDLEANPKMVNRIRLMDGDQVLPPPSKRVAKAPTSKSKRGSYKKFIPDEPPQPELVEPQQEGD